jgi:hypothetical protein
MERPSAKAHLHFVSAIKGEPLVDPSKFWFVPYLEQNFAGILEEIEAVRDPQSYESETGSSLGRLASAW